MLNAKNKVLGGCDVQMNMLKIDVEWKSIFKGRFSKYCL